MLLISLPSDPKDHTALISLLLCSRDGQYIVILRAHNNRIVVVLQLSSYRLRHYQWCFYTKLGIHYLKFYTEVCTQLI